MYQNPFNISIETLIGVSTILGHRLEDRYSVRTAQDAELVRFAERGSTVSLRGPSQKSLFCVAPIDVLVTDDDGKKRFHIIELNGTGIGGLTNISEKAVAGVLEGMYEMAADCAREAPLILVASSGLESEQMPRQNKLIYEKVLFAEALKRGFESQGARAAVTTLTQARDAPWELNNQMPTIVVGYMKQFLRFLHPNNSGQLTLFGRTVQGAVNDRFCLNLVHSFGESLDLGQLRTMNRCFLAGADKAVAYRLLNDFLAQSPSDVTRPVHFVQVPTREQLLDTVLQWVSLGRKVVIKPQGTGLGHGIEFFLHEEAEAAIATRIDASLRQTEQYYGLVGGALPYTVCEFLDTATIQHEDHPMQGHKFELRVVVYRDGDKLKAFPSIIKVASQVYHADKPAYMSLINNITASAVASQSAGVEHMMPLARQETLDLIDLKPEDLREVSSLVTNYVRYVLDQVEDAPEKLGLPAGVQQGTPSPVA